MITPEQLEGNIAFLELAGDYADDNKRHERIVEFATNCESSLNELDSFVKNHHEIINQFLKNLDDSGVDFSFIFSKISKSLIGCDADKISSVEDVENLITSIRSYVKSAKVKHANLRDVQWYYLLLASTWIATLKGLFVFGDDAHHYLAAVKKRDKLIRQKGGNGKAEKYSVIKKFVFEFLEENKAKNTKWNNKKHAAKRATLAYRQSEYYRQDPEKNDVQEDTVYGWICKQ